MTHRPCASDLLPRAFQMLTRAGAADAGVRGVRFVRPPSEQPYGTVAVFEDLYGNRWDLIQYNGSTPYV